MSNACLNTYHVFLKMFSLALKHLDPSNFISEHASISERKLNLFKGPLPSSNFQRPTLSTNIDPSIIPMPSSKLFIAIPTPVLHILQPAHAKWDAA